MTKYSNLNQNQTVNYKPYFNLKNNSRLKEFKSYLTMSRWLEIPGSQNPTDLPADRLSSSAGAKRCQGCYRVVSLSHGTANLWLKYLKY